MPGNSLALRVLLVEDSALLAGRLEELIRRLPDMDLVATVDTEDEAISRIAQTVPNAVLLDLHLRKGSGFGVLRALARAAPRPKVIVLTNYGLTEYQREAEALGATAFLDKARDLGRLPSLLLNLSRQHALRTTP